MLQSYCIVGVKGFQVLGFCVFVGSGDPSQNSRSELSSKCGLDRAMHISTSVSR